jgi:hypothetical protein
MTARSAKSRVRVIVRTAAVACVIVVAMQTSGSSRAQDTAGAVDNLFAGEPSRPKADSPIVFSHSWEESRALAKRTGRRLLAYFTSDSCGWCRAMEKRTFTDAEVVTLSKEFVCAQVDIRDEKNVRVADEFRIDSIPRTYVFTSDGKLIDRRTGYVPAAEYAAWLKKVGTTAPPVAVDAEKAVPPAAVGAPAAVANLVVWFVDATRDIARWSDRDWTSHSHLLRLLHAAGIEARVEHIAREDFPARWDAAVAASQIPDLISAQNRGGLIKQLDVGGRLKSVHSDRLTWMTELASCSDFYRRFLYVVNGSEHQVPAQQTIVELLRPAPEMKLPGTELSDKAGSAEAALIARDAVVAYFSGDLDGMKRVAAASSPQLKRCTSPPRFRLDCNVDTGAIDLRGNEAIAFAKVEMRFHGKSRLGGDPVLVVLVREAQHWMAFSVGNDVYSIKALPTLCALQLRSPAERPSVTPTPRLLRPADGGAIGEGGETLAWEVPAGGEALAAQVCEVLLDDKHCSWPLSRVKVYSGKPRSYSLLAADTAANITGLLADEMHWCVWAIGASGRVSPSETRAYRELGFKY